MWWFKKEVGVVHSFLRIILIYILAGGAVLFQLSTADGDDVPETMQNTKKIHKQGNK